MLKRLLIYASFLLAAFPLLAQQIVPSLMGTDFWVSFMNNTDNRPSACSLIIASEYDCTAHISNPRQGWDTVVTLVNGICRVQVPGTPPLPPPGYSIIDDGWHVTTSAPSVLYASNYYSASHDMTSVMPTPTLRRDYMTQTYGNFMDGQEVYVVAPYDSTLLHISFGEEVLGTADSIIYAIGDTLDVLLMRGQTCRLFSASNHNSLLGVGFSGTRIQSSRPVAVFQGHNSTGVPVEAFFYDHLYEQSIPSDFWGRHFLVIPTTGRVASGTSVAVGDMVKVTSLKDNCVLSFDGRDVAHLSAGESYTFFLSSQLPDSLPGWVSLEHTDLYQSEALFVESSSPVQVCFYITGITFGGDPGDPAVVVVPPLEQGISHTMAAVYNTLSVTNHYINVVTSTDDARLMTLDGQSIAANFTATDEGYSYARLTVGEGLHVLDADTGRFLATFYGLGYAESYAYIAGMAVRSAEYDVRVSSHSVCLGDTVSVNVVKDDSLGVEWYIDGRYLASDVNTMHLPFDSVGVYCMTVVITPVGDTVWEIITVHPVYTGDVSDSICVGDTLVWNGMPLTDESAYTAGLTSTQGCDSTVTMHLTLRDNAPIPSIAVNPDCPSQSYTLQSIISEDPDNIIAWWRSSPADSTLASQQWDSLVVTPVDTTLYALHIEGCHSYDTVVVLLPLISVEARMSVSRNRLNANSPSFTARDSSLRATGRNWWVDRVWAGDSPLLQDTSELASDSLKLTLAAYNETCADTLTRVILVDAFSVWVPNVFTPGEEENRLFAPVLNGAHAEELVIYDRLGMLIVRLEGPEPAWDGTHNNIPCQQGVYAYELRYRASNDPAHLLKKQGLVTLLR